MRRSIATATQALRHSSGVALHRASDDDYEDTWLPNGSHTATPEDAFDLAAYLP